MLLEPLLVVVSLLDSAGPARAAAPPPQPQLGQPIADIRYEIHNVFDVDSPGEANPLFSLANGVHRRTRRQVIERELLFRAGDPFAPALLSETERNLRTLPFLRKVEIVGVQTSRGPVVIVRTWDAWTLEVDGRFNRTGGVNDAQIGAGDFNMLGYGKSVSARYGENSGVPSRSLLYHDPQLLRTPHLIYDLSANQQDGVRHYKTSLAKPFYATITRSSLSSQLDYLEDRPTVYQGLSPAGAAARRNYNAGLTYGYAFEATTRRTRRFTLGLLHQYADFAALPSQPALFVPEPERHTSVQAGYDFQNIKFIKQKHIQKLSREEDYNVAPGFTAALGYSPRLAALATTGELLQPSLELRDGFVSELGQFLFLRADYLSTYVNGGNGDAVATADIQYFCRFFPRNTIAAHAQFDRGWRLDAPTLLTLGEDNGLRGYRAKQFQGDRRLLFNLEDRVFFFEDLFKLADAGGVVFFDSGNVWMPNERFALGGLKSSYGVGLRLAATRSANNDPVRIDLAHALNDNHFP